MRYFVWILLILLVIVRYLTIRPDYKDGDRVRITASLYREPQRYSSLQVVELAGLKVELPNFPEINYGDKLEVEGRIRGKKLENAKIISLKESSGIFPKLRGKVIAFYERSLPEPHASLVAGITIGSKSSIPKDFWQRLKKTGTLHVVVASGTNVTILTGFLLSLFVIFLKRKFTIFFVVLGIIFYLLLSGFEPPLIRAAFMGSLAFFAQEKGRVITPLRILFLTGIIMLLIVPSWIFDIGFILSFVATASLIIFQKRIEKRLSFIPKVLRQDFSTSLAAQIGVTPILLVSFGQFNLFSPLINAMIIWTVPPIMIIAGVGGLVGLVVPEAGRLILYLSYPLTWWFTQVISLFS